jgi:hypothetical protein
MSIREYSTKEDGPEDRITKDCIEWIGEKNCLEQTEMIVKKINHPKIS